MYDAHLAAQRRLGGADVPIVVSESGWPSAGGNGATMENAGTYYRNLIAHVKRRSIENVFGCDVDEDQKLVKESEKYFGVFFPNQSFPGRLVAGETNPGRHVARDKLKGKARQGFIPERLGGARIVSGRLLNATVDYFPG
ncbi:glucan endo-1,3-beta-glucosidase-like protein [Tanacetum coccineum]